MPNYLEVIGGCFSGAEAYLPSGGDPTVYGDLVWVTAPVSQVDLDASPCANNDLRTKAGNTEIVGVLDNTLFQLIFQRESTVSNAWLSHHGSNSLTSDASPAIIPFACNLVAVTFSNDKANIDFGLDLHRAKPGDGSVNDIPYSWDLIDVRTGYDTSMAQDPANAIMFEAGDKLAVFVRKITNKVPRNFVAKLSFQIVEVNTTETIENWNGDLPL